MIGFNEPAYAAIVWSAQTPAAGDELQDISAVDASTAWVVGNGGAIQYTTDGGTTWSSQTSGTTQILLGVSAVDANTAWVVGGSGTIRYTTDAGTTWSTQTSGTGNILQEVSAVDANTAWAVGQTGTILYTTDAGTTWTSQTSGTTNGLFGVSAVDANTAWAVGGSGTILYTTNAGTTWNAQTGSLSSFVDVFALDANTAWTTATGGIERTTNAGGTWTLTLFNIPSTQQLNSVSFIDANTGWMVGRQGSPTFAQVIHYSIDGGASWTEQSSGTTPQLTGVSAINENIAWAAGLSGTILKSSNPATLAADVNIQGVCEVDLASGSLSFVSGDPISNGIGVGTGEISEVMTNTLGNLVSQTSVYGTDWTDGGALTVMLGSNTRVDDVSGVISSKDALSTNSGSPTALANIAPQGSITSYWDVAIVMDSGALGYSGASVQTITVDFTCI